MRVDVRMISYPVHPTMCCFVFSRFVNIFVVIVSLKHALHSYISLGTMVVDGPLDGLRGQSTRRCNSVQVQKMEMVG